MKIDFKKWQKVGFVAASILAVLCFLLLIPAVQNLAIFFAEKVLLRRPLARHGKWLHLMKIRGFGGVLFFSVIALGFRFWGKIKTFFKTPLEKSAKNAWVSFLLGAVYGMLLFVILYGVKILNVKYDAWLLTGGDLSQHYIGWTSYRFSRWHFPIGLMDRLSYPNSTSVIYTDSIPLFAFFFKLISPILPNKFQYFGLYGIFSYAMMGGFSILLLKKLIGNFSASLVLSTIFIYSPYVLQRMYGHTSLAGQWLIIAALWLWLCNPVKKASHNFLLWAALLFVAAAIHSYFIPMCMIVCFANCIEDFVCKKQKDAIIRFLSATFGGVFSLFVFGAFYGKTNPSTGGLGYFSSNLNTFIDSQGTSFFLKPLKHGGGQYEGFGYLGLGVILLVLVATFYCFCIRRGEKEIDNFEEKISKRRLRLLFIAFAIFFVLAVFPKMQLGERVLLEIPLPKIIEKFLGIFRSSGRFIWGACYILMLLAITILWNAMEGSRIKKIPVAVFVALIQIVDLSPNLFGIHFTQKYREHVPYNSGLSENAWLHLFETKKHLIFQPYNTFSFDNKGKDLSFFAITHGADTNTSYFARPNTAALKEFSDLIDKELANGIVRDDAIYIFNNETLNLKEYPLFYHVFDNRIVGLSSEDAEFERNQKVLKHDVRTELSGVTDILEYLGKIKNPNYSVFIAVKDEGSGGLSDDARQKLSELGLKTSLKGQWRKSYLVAIIGGKIVYENLGEARLSTNGQFANGKSKYSIASAGMNCGNSASIVVNENEYAKNYRGLNIVVFDNEKNIFVDSVTFDTCDKEMKAYR